MEMFNATNVAAATEVASEAVVRMLMSESETYKKSNLVSQVFSGVFFTGLAFWLSFSNGTRLSYIQHAALEKRLTVCSFLDTYVAGFSAFFNFFQLTEIQYLVLPRPSRYVLSVARPIEWICTCPIMQLVLVLMGGSRIPEYRRMLMPLLSEGILFCGFAAALVEDPWRYVCYATSFVIFMGMFTLNRIQIIEHSQGQESLWSGDSEFRKATILMMLTWIPFPLWFALSPEGFEIIDDILIIQVGWAFLNIVAKFAFIFYIQRIKDNYCSRLKVRRELFGAQQKMNEAFGNTTPVENPVNKAQGEMTAVLVETMNFLGMAQHTDRFMRLLKRAEVTSLDQVEQMTKETCEKQQLPWDLVSALQKRFRVWKLEMQDNAELELEKGELHYAAEDPMSGAIKKLTNQADGFSGVIMQGDQMGHAMSDRHPFGAYAPGMMTPTGQMTPPYTPTGQMTPPYGQPSTSMGDLSKGGASVGHLPDSASTQPGPSNAELEARFDRMEELMISFMRKADGIQGALAQQQQESEANLARRLEYVVGQALASAQRAHEADVEGGLRQRMEELVGSAADRLRATADALGLSLQSKIDDFAAKHSQLESDARGSWLRRLEEAIAKSSEHAAKSAEAAALRAAKSVESVGQNLQAKADSQHAAQLRRLEELETAVARRLEEMTGKVLERSERVAEATRSALQADMGTVMGRSDLVAEAIREASHTQKEGVADLRRMTMMVLEQASGAQERSQGHSAQLTELRGAVDAGLERLSASVSDLKWASQMQKPLLQHQHGLAMDDSGMQGAPPQQQRRGFEETPHGRQTARYGMQVISG